MSQLVPEPCPFCGGKRRYGAGRAPCLCTLGTGEERGAVVMRIPKPGLGWRKHPTHWRPKTREDCAKVPRPCPYVGCVFNLYLQGHGPDIKVTCPHRNPWDVPPEESCELDIADRGGMTLEGVAHVLNCTRERIRQVEFAALAKVRKELNRRGVEK